MWFLGNLDNGWQDLDLGVGLGVFDFDDAFAFGDFSDGVDCFTCFFELADDALGEGGADDEAVSDSHVEDFAHFFGVDVALVLEELEDRGGVPCVHIDGGVDLVVEGAVEVAF